jgi:thiamine-phosphate pyrophosphorylase
MTKDYLKLFLILESDYLRIPLPDFIEQTASAGITALQLRDKSCPERKRFETAKILAPVLKKRGIPFIINNSADIAAAVRADGVHLGADDFPPEAVKPLFKELLVGCSCRSAEEAAALFGLDIDYLGIGALFSTSTKKDHLKPLGISGAEEILNSLPKDLAASVIGGIDESNVAEVARLGAGICISRAICASPEPYETVKRILSLIDLRDQTAMFKNPCK